MKAASVAGNYLYDFGIQLMKIAINSIEMMTVCRHIYIARARLLQQSHNNDPHTDAHRTHKVDKLSLYNQI